MKIIEHPDHNYIVLKLHGEIDASSAINLDESIKKAFETGSLNLLVDCENLEYISSAGLGVFMSYIKGLQAENKQMILFALNESVFSTFEILGLHHIISIVATKEQALKKCL